jgi:dipeptidyl aminopeptidase/acylaminoacyl peptidase
MGSMRSHRSAALLAAILLSGIVAAQDPIGSEKYLMPPRHIADAVLAPWHTNRSVTNISPDRTRYLVVDREPLVPLERMSRPYLNLAGIQIDPVAMRARTLTTRSNLGVTIVEIASKRELPVQLPSGALLSDPTWSPDGKHLAFFANFPDRTEIYVADAATGRTRQVTRERAMPVMHTTLEWVDNGRSIVATMMPDGPRSAPSKEGTPNSPRVQVTSPRPSRIRTYASLITTPIEQEMLEFYTTSQLARVDVATGRVHRVGKPEMIKSVDAQPTGKFFRVVVMEKPFSYLFPASSFPEREVIRDDSGEEKSQIRRRGAPGGATGSELDHEDMHDACGPDCDELWQQGQAAAPVQGRGAGAGAGAAQAAAQNRPGERRNLTWRPDGEGLVFLQTTGTGDAAKDRLVFWKPPYGDNDTEVLYEVTGRLGNIRFGPDAKTLFITQSANNVNTTSIMRPGGQPVKLFETRTGEDDPVDLLMTRGPQSGSVVRLSSDGQFAYLSGNIRAAGREDFPRPFLERIRLSDGERTRIWESAGELFESATALDDDLNAILVVRQSSAIVPQTFYVDLQNKRETQLTENKDFTPDLTQAKRERIMVTRPDGVKFQVRITAPSWHMPGMRMPAFFWFYPREFVDQATYDRTLRGGNRNTFSTVSGSNKAIFLRAGYLLIEPDCPIIGPAERKNDQYVPQLRNNMFAVIEELDRQGYIDRNKLAIGGHSYGGFSTANAMIHTPFFKAGIAGAGNFNRLLTPFGFQSDQRQMWEARETYLSISPILWAEQMTGALLLYHGAEDQNMGTSPINSERMFGAMEALGKPAALYMYPYEDHGQVGRETVLDQWARWIAWLDKHVKGE